MINEDSVEIAAELCSKEEALIKLAQLHRAQGNIYDLRRFLSDIRDREMQSSGAISGRIAITALSDRTARDTRITAITVKDGIEYGSPDRRPVKLIFLIAGRNNSDEYLALKTRLMRLLMDSVFSAKLCSAKDKREFVELIGERERIRFAPPEPKKEYDCSKFLIKKIKKRSLRDLIPINYQKS